MGTAPATKSQRLKWYSYPMLGLVAVALVVIFGFFSSDLVAGWVRWTVTISWLVVATFFAILDFEGPSWLGWLKDGARAIWRFLCGLVGVDPEGEIDNTPVDRWTFIHGTAGFVFGVWLIPFAFVVVLTALWELFEILVPGFGESEKWWNRLVDVGVALLGWLIVVVIVMAAKDIDFPMFEVEKPA
jgi:hypothetical protein